MSTTVFVKVVGFRDVERHALNSVFRLSGGRAVAYSLWTPDAPMPAQLLLIDVESYEGGLELASPGFNPNLKMMAVGAHPPATAWRSFPRPLNWSAVVHAMDQLFTGSEGADIDIETGESSARIVPPGVRVCLLADASRDRRMYLRARLALAGLTEIADAPDAGQALVMARDRHFHLALVNLDAPQLDGWKLAGQLVALEPAIGSVVLSTQSPTWQTQERAELVGCRGVLEVPFDPGQILGMLRRV